MVNVALRKLTNPVPLISQNPNYFLPMWNLVDFIAFEIAYFYYRGERLKIGNFKGATGRR